jgi:hypothetical protein
MERKGKLWIEVGLDGVMAKTLKTKMPRPPVKFVNAIIIHWQKLNEIGKHFQKLNCWWNCHIFWKLIEIGIHFQSSFVNEKIIIQFPKHKILINDNSHIFYKVMPLLFFSFNCHMFQKLNKIQSLLDTESHGPWWYFSIRIR